jgi:STE24 endopeptidase
VTSPAPSTRLCLWLVVVSTVGLVVLGGWLIPWSWVPGGDIVPVRGSEVFSAGQLARGESYSTMQRHLGWASLAVSTLLTLLLGLTPLGARLVRRLHGPWWVRALLATLALLVLGELATAPFALRARSNALDYGITDQALGGWLRDQVMSLLVAWVFAGVLVLLVVGTARRSPRRWPLWTALAGAVLTVLGSWVYPVVVEPLFNEFTSLPDGALRSEVMALARAEEVPVSDVLVADASRRTTTLNAYVSGLGSTRRVVLYDNLVDDVPRREALIVVAHELAHAKHQDVLVGTVLAALGAVLGTGLLGLLLGNRRLLVLSGASGPAQPEVVPLLLALAAIGTLVASPVGNTASRAVEARADRTSLEATGDYQGFERMQTLLATRSLSDDDPPRWSHVWFGSHPTTLQRIGLARALEQQAR